MTRPITRSAVIETLLADLDRMKERGVVGAELELPPWAGGDSDAETFECGVCFADMPLMGMVICEHCERAFCKECVARHATWIRGERWG